jgi:hypothetical protein
MVGYRKRIARWLLVAAIAGCEPSDEGQQGLASDEELSPRQQELYARSLGIWTGREISVCWVEPGLATEKRWVREAIASTWAKRSGLTFVGWLDCPPSNAPWPTSDYHGISIFLSSVNATYLAENHPVESGPTGYPLIILDVERSQLETYYPRCRENALNREQCIRAVAVHEMGHALGFEHEHERPTTPASCTDREARSGTADITFGPYDPDSIMNYCTPKATPSDQDYSGLVDLYGAEVAAPLAQRTSGLCIHPQSNAIIPSEGTAATLGSACSSDPQWALELHPFGFIRHPASGMCLGTAEATLPTNGTRLVFTSSCYSFNSLFTLTASGSLKSAFSGKCVHPLGGSATPPSETPLVFWDGCDEPRLSYRGVFTGPARIGHVAGQCVHPEGGAQNPANGTRAVLWNNCTKNGPTNYIITASGSIKHVASGKCLHPSGGSSNPGNGTELVFWSGCDEPRLAFELTPRGSLRHVASGRCVHPSGGAAEPSVGTKLVLWDGCDSESLGFGALSW